MRESEVIVMLNVRQEKFCLEYAKCGNATESAKKAGYAEKTSYSIGQRLLKKVEVKNRLQELAKIAEDAKIADIQEMQQRLTSIIRQETEEEVIVVEGCGDGCSEARVMTKTASLKDIINAIDKLGRMQGAFNEKVQIDMLPVIIKGEMPDDY